MDDTGTRVNGVNQHCQVICNPLYGAYFTTARKDRLTIIDVLRNGRERIFRLNEEALGLMLQFGISQRVLERVGQLPFHQNWSQEELQRRLTEQIPDLASGARHRIIEAAALFPAYHAESGHVRLLVCDDARQFQLVADELALCWVHDGRHYQSMAPVPRHREWLEAFRNATIARFSSWISGYAPVSHADIWPLEITMPRFSTDSCILGSVILHK